MSSWEHREVVIPLNIVVKGGLWYPGDNIMTLDPLTELHVNQLIMEKVQELAREGWEPEQSYTFRDLARAGLLMYSYKSVSGFLGMNHRTDYYLQSIFLRMKRTRV